MFKNSKVIVIATVLTTLLSAIPMYASVTTDTGTTETSSVKHSQARPDNNGFKSKLDSLVTAGTLTSDQETAIKSAMEAARPVKTDNAGADQHKSERTNRLTAALDKLVTAGTITAEQEETIISALTSN